MVFFRITKEETVGLTVKGKVVVEILDGKGLKIRWS